MTRKQQREAAFVLLFRIDFHSPEEMGEQMESCLSEFKHEDEDFELEEASEEDLDYIGDKCRAVMDKLAEIDGLIEKHAENWSLKRIAKADLTLLRLGVYELCFDDTIPIKVAINEAVELAKKYGTDKTSGFVNAILGKVSRSMEASADGEDIDSITD